MYVRIKGRIYKVYEENGEFYIIRRIPSKERVDPLNVVHEDFPKKPKKIGVNVRPLIDSDKKLRKTVEELEKLSAKEKSLREEFEKAKKNLMLCETRNGELIELITQIAASKGLPRDDAIEALRQIRDFIKKCTDEMTKITLENKELINQIKQLKREVDTCNSRLRDCETKRPVDCKDAERNNAELRTEIERLNDEIERLRRQPPPQVAVPDCSHLERTIEQLQDQIENLRANPNCRTFQDIIEQLQQEIQQLRGELEETRNPLPPQIAVPDCSHLERTIEQLQDQIENLIANPDCSQLQDILDRSQYEIQQLRDEIDALRFEAMRKPVPDCREAERIAAQLRQDIEQLRNNPDCRKIEETLRRRIGLLETELEGLQNLPPPRVPDCSDAERMVQELRAEIVDLKNKLKLQLQDTLEFHAEAQSLRSRPTDCNNFEETIKEQKVQLARLTAVADELNSRMAQLAQERDRAIAEIEALRRTPPPQVAVPDCTKLQETVDRLQREINNLQANPDCGKVQKVADKLKGQTETLEAELEKLRNELGDCGNLKKDIERLKKEYELARKEAGSMGNINEGLQHEIQSLLVTINMLRGRWEAMENETKRLQSRIEQLEHNPPPQVAVPIPDCSAVIAQLNDAKHLIEQLQLENAPKDCDREERRIEDLTKAVDTQERKLQELTRQNERLEAKLRERIPANCDKYITEIANLHRSIEQTVEENRRTVNDLKDTHEQRVRAESERAGQIQNALDKLKEAHRQLQEKIPEMDRDLPQKHETLRLEFADLLQQFKELQSKASKQEENLIVAQRQTDEMQREGETIAQENSNLRQEVRNLNSQIETTTELIIINSAQRGVLGRNRHYLLEKIGSLILECKTDADAQRTVAEVMDKELEAKQEYAMLENQITRLTGVGDPNAALSMMFKV